MRNIDIPFAIWFLTLHGVNAIIYLAVTRWSAGRVKTLLGLLVNIGVVMLAVVLAKRLDFRPEIFAKYSFLLAFGGWLVVTLAMSRGPFARNFFAAVLSGAHQLAISVVCYAVMKHVQPPGLAKVLASLLMASMAANLVCRVLPRLWRISPAVDWRILDVVVCIQLASVYACGFWPIWAPGGTWRDAIPFCISVASLVSFFPVVFHLSEKCSAAARLAQVEDNMRLMVDEIRTRRMSIDEARRVRHDQRHHCATLIELLNAKNCDKALAYVKDLESELDGMTAASVWCDNETVNAILSGFSRKALVRQVKLQVDVTVPRQLAIPDVELVAVLANLIENAQHAAPEDTVVEVWLSWSSGMLRFRVKNDVPDGFVLHGGMPCEVEGIGLQSVRAVLSRHGGEIAYSLDGHRLTAEGYLSCG